jgi:tetratricopeptide (TPR) repeat protein
MLEIMEHMHFGHMHLCSDQCVDASRQAIKDYRKHVLGCDGNRKPAFAKALHLLAETLLDLPQHYDRALAAIAEAVAVWREHAKEQPNTYESDFASSLYLYSKVLSAVGFEDKALGAVLEAAHLNEKLLLGTNARDRPWRITQIYDPLLYDLGNFGWDLCANGEYKRALALFETAIHIYQSASCTPWIGDRLSSYLEALSLCCTRWEMHTDALKAATLARELRKQIQNVLEMLDQRPQDLTSKNQQPVNSYDRQQAMAGLAHISRTLAHCWLACMRRGLVKDNDRPLLLPLLQESVELYRRLVAESSQPEEFQSQLRQSLVSLATVLRVLKKDEEARRSEEQAAHIKGPDTEDLSLAVLVSSLDFIWCETCVDVTDSGLC